MAGIQISEAKAPWIMFERRPVEDRQASIAQGRYVAKDEDFVLITPHGSKDQIERVVRDWLEHNENEVKQGRLDPSWQRKYREAYSNWCEGKEVPVEGTPIINWPLLSPSQVRMLQDLRILTVEILAEANEEAIRRMGMGGRGLVQKAKEFLAQTKTGKTTEEVVAMQAKIEGLQGIVEKQAEQISQLIAQLGTKAQAEANSGVNPDPNLGGGPGIGASDLLDPPAAPKLTKL